MAQPDHPTGVAFATIDGKRSTLAAGQAVVERALRAADALGADSAHRETSWRQGYVPHFKRLVQAGLQSPADSLAIATAGLSAVHDAMEFVLDGESLPLSAAALPEGQPRLETGFVEGRAAAEQQFTLPYRGERLAGNAIRTQVDAWVAAGAAEPELATVLNTVLDNPDWLQLRDYRVVLLGGAAEMGPLRPLLRWGAHLCVVDLPRPGLWAGLFNEVRRSAGTMSYPTRINGSTLPQHAGVNVMHHPGAVKEWLLEQPGRLAVGNYVYADGALNVRATTAIDVLTEALCADRPDTALAFLATPTDVFAVPDAAVAAATAAYEKHSWRKVLRGPVKALSVGRLLRRNYIPDALPGLNDSIVVQQGPNYLLAKRIQRWRAEVARTHGTTVSFSVAPPTATKSVTKNKLLAAAYASAHRFGIDVFAPSTASTLLAACMVYHLHTEHNEEHNWRNEAFAAVHGGLWRAAYDSRSSLGLAAVMGLATSTS